MLRSVEPYGDSGATRMSGPLPDAHRLAGG